MQMKELATSLAHIGIPTLDLDETILFYSELGFEIALLTQNPNNGARVCFLRLGDLLVEAYEGEGAALCHGAIDHLAIAVTDIEETYKAIQKRGLNNTEDTIHFLPYWEKGTRYFTIEGPNKEKIEFAQVL